MSGEPKITVKKIGYAMPVVLLGKDEQGRQQYVCPSLGCGETAYFDEDGKGHCPVDEALMEALRSSLRDSGLFAAPAITKEDEA